MLFTTPLDAITSGQPLQTDLLTDLPDSNDPAQWPKPAWDGYESLFQNPEIRWNADGGCVFTLSLQFGLDSGKLAQVKFVAVTLGGQLLAWGPLQPAGFTVPNQNLQLSFFVMPWQP